MAIQLEEIRTDENFDEEAYLEMHLDVAAAVREKQFESGMQHYQLFGRSEGRIIRFSKRFLAAKQRKLKILDGLVDKTLDYTVNEQNYNFLTPEMRSDFNIPDFYVVSSNPYDDDVRNIINTCNSGIVLDCGAGKRPVYYENVVNFDIAAYDTTDVIGVGERLPFIDNAFDAIISIAVLEHVKDPFCCAREIVRVLKHGGILFCCVPFLQPFHGCPHHYYNMTKQGLYNLFCDYLRIDKQVVVPGTSPMFTLSWFLKSWAEGLSGNTKESFMNMQIRDLLGNPFDYLSCDFTKELSEEKNFELASCTILYAVKE